VLAARGTAKAGTRIERLVLVERRTARTVEPSFRSTRRVTLPRRTPNATIEVEPAGNTTVDRVRVDGRVILDRPAGLNGTYTVGVPRYRTATLEFEGTGRLDRGDVRVTFYPARTRKARLVVAVERRGVGDG
jgi:RNase P/RNase MRP subunit p29